jgi:predicted nucleic acid-binding protein
MIVVSDTSPLRALQTIKQVPLLTAAFGEVLLPPAVAAELEVAVPSLGAFPLSSFPFLKVRAPLDVAQVSRLRAELNAGEAEALALASELRAGVVLIDESPGRRVAARMGLRTMGVLALLVQAKRLGQLNAVAPLVEELAEKINFRISAELRQRILRDAGEFPGD